MKSCSYCNKEFSENSNKQVFCSTNCRVYYNRKKDKTINSDIVVPKDVVIALKYFEKIESTQGIINFLADFWLKNKLISNEKKEVKTPIEVKKIKHEEPPQFNIPPEPPKYRRTESYFMTSMRVLDKDDTNAILQLKKEAEESTDISERQRTAILHSLKNGTY
jgi:hypothetical protein